MNSLAELLTADPVEMAKKVMADLSIELGKLKMKRDQELLPWIERLRASTEEDDQRLFSRRMREIERNYEGSIQMIEREIGRICLMLPSKPIVVTISETNPLPGQGGQ